MRKILDILAFSIPEALVLFTLASSLLGRKFPLRRLTVMAITFGITIYWNRQITGNYILSILLSGFLIILLLKQVGTVEIYAAITSGLMSISLYLTIEFINVKTLQVLTGIDPATLQIDFIRRVIWFLPELLSTLALSHIIRYFINHYGNRKLIIKENEYEDKYKYL